MAVSSIRAIAIIAFLWPLRFLIERYRLRISGLRLARIAHRAHWTSLHIFWVCKDNFARCLKDVVNGNPVFAGGLHADIFTVVGTKPICAQSQVLCEGGKTPTLVSRYAALIRGCNAGNKKRLVNIHSTANRVNNFKHSSSPQNKDWGNRQGLDTHWKIE